MSPQCQQFELLSLGCGLLGDTLKHSAIPVRNLCKISLSNFRFPAFKFLYLLISVQVTFT